MQNLLQMNNLDMEEHQAEFEKKQMKTPNMFNFFVVKFIYIHLLEVK